MSKSAVRYSPDSFEPTQEQIDIQMASDEAMMIEANAGAGKTTTLALRIAQAIKSGTDPARIKVLTFTEPACEAMVDALKKIGLDWRFSQKIGIQTFDQFAQSILHGLERKRIPFLPTKEDVAPYVHQVVHALDIPADSDFVERFLNASQKIKGTLIREQKLWRDEALTEDDSENLQIDPVFFKVTKAYEHLRFPNRDGSDRPLFRGPFDATYDLACLLGNPEPTTYVSEIPDWPTHIRMLLIDEMH
jgi:DNA helicase II / ATP-dependent DNA helicase PcrA